MRSLETLREQIVNQSGRYLVQQERYGIGLLKELFEVGGIREETGELLVQLAARRDEEKSLLMTEVSDRLVIESQLGVSVVWKIGPQSFYDLLSDRQYWQQKFGIKVKVDNKEKVTWLRVGEEKFGIHTFSMPRNKVGMYTDRVLDEELVYKALMLYPKTEVKERGLVVGDLKTESTTAVVLPGHVLARYGGRGFEEVEDTDVLYILELVDVDDETLELVEQILREVKPIGVLFKEVGEGEWKEMELMEDRLMLRCQYCENVIDVTKLVKELERSDELTAMVVCGSCGGAADLHDGKE